ncbi:MAG: CopG family transcriptional regulator [Chloroflexi bacterium]|nr:CopG family transcriptional regulator [Chloroflexota bacterium]
MGKSTITITMDDAVLETLDDLVRNSVYPDRSLAIQEAVKDKFTTVEDAIFERELAKLDPDFERQMSEEGLAQDLLEWPEY